MPYINLHSTQSIREELFEQIDLKESDTTTPPDTKDETSTQGVEDVGEDASKDERGYASNVDEYAGTRIPMRTHAGTAHVSQHAQYSLYPQHSQHLQHPQSSRDTTTREVSSRNAPRNADITARTAPAYTSSMHIPSSRTSSPRTVSKRTVLQSAQQHDRPSHISISEIDSRLIHFFRNISDPMARFGLFVVFFWFGALKVIDMSPASPLVQALFERTIPFMPFSIFLIIFGAFEMVIGLMFLIKGFEREVLPLLTAHMITTAMPLILLGAVTWTAPFVPTMEGQYIIKNLVIVATAIAVAAHIHPMPRKRSQIVRSI